MMRLEVNGGLEALLPVVRRVIFSDTRRIMAFWALLVVLLLGISWRTRLKITNGLLMSINMVMMSVMVSIIIAITMGIMGIMSIMSITAITGTIVGVIHGVARMTIERLVRDDIDFGIYVLGFTVNRCCRA